MVQVTSCIMVKCPVIVSVLTYGPASVENLMSRATIVER